MHLLKLCLRFFESAKMSVFLGEVGGWRGVFWAFLFGYVFVLACFFWAVGRRLWGACFVIGGCFGV